MKTWIPWDDANGWVAWGAGLLIAITPVIFGGTQLFIVLAYALSCLWVTGASFDRNRFGQLRIFSLNKNLVPQNAAWLRMGVLALGLVGLGVIPAWRGAALYKNALGVEVFLAMMVMTWLAVATTVPWCSWLLGSSFRGCVAAVGLHLVPIVGLVYLYILLRATRAIDSGTGAYEMLFVLFSFSFLLSLSGVFIIGHMIRGMDHPSARFAKWHRLWKEARALGWSWVAAIFIPVAVVSMVPLWHVFCITNYLTLLCLAGLVFGHEYQCQTLGLLLSQPVSRRRLWYEKMGLNLFAVMSAMAITHIMAFTVSPINHVVTQPTQDAIGSISLGWTPLFAILGAIATVPALLLCLRNIMAAITFTPLLQFLVGMVAMMALNGWEPDLANSEETQGLALLILVGFSGLMYLFGCWRFARLEWAQPLENPLPGLPMMLRKRQASSIRKGRGPAWVNLLSKEFQLHRVSFWLAAGFCVICAIMAGLRGLYLNNIQTEMLAFATPDFIRMPLWIYFFMAPLVIGSVCMADERSIGLWEWHLTLPPARKLQWAIKVLAVYAICLVLCVLLPFLWLYVYHGLGLMEQPDAWGIPLLPVVLVTLVITSVAIYASSFSQSTVKAILTAMGLLVLGMVLFGIFTNHFRPERIMQLGFLTFFGVNLGEFFGFIGIDTILLTIGNAYGIAGLFLAFLVLLHWVSWVNYRRITTERRLQLALVPILLALVGSLLAVVEVALLHVSMGI